MMNVEVLSSSNINHKIKLDPRTKLIILIIICIVVVGGENRGPMIVIKPLLSIIPLFLLFFQGKRKTSVISTFVYIICWAGENYAVSIITGNIGFVVLLISAFIGRLLPGAVMGYYTLQTTKVSEFIAAMECIHLPQKIIIPVSVMFRFFPTVMEEFQAIGHAMRMRGIRFGLKKTGKVIEYRLVPMIICSVKIGEELSAAALTRGLGAPVKRTNICEIGFSFWDYIFIICCLAIVICILMYRFRII